MISWQSMQQMKVRRAEATSRVQAEWDSSAVRAMARWKRGLERGSSGSSSSRPAALEFDRLRSLIFNQELQARSVKSYHALKPALAGDHGQDFEWEIEVRAHKA